MTVHLSDQTRIGHDMLPPIATYHCECYLAELGDRVVLTRADNVITGHLSLQHKMHGFNVVAGVTEVTSHV